MFEKPFRHLRDFGVGQTGVGLADILQAVAVPYRKGVVTEHSDALAMAVLDRGDDDVEGGQFALEFQP